MFTEFLDLTDILLVIAIVLLLAVVALQVVLLFRKTTVDLSPLQQALQATDMRPLAASTPS